MIFNVAVDFVEFVRPDSYWPHPYTTEQAFEVLRWMVSTGEKYERPTRWGRNGPIEAMSRAPTCTNFSQVDPISSLADLRERFSYALLSGMGGAGLCEWRENEQIKVGSTRKIRFRHYKPFSGGAGWHSEHDIIDAINKLFADGKSRKIKVSLNTSHKTAKTCKSVEICITSSGFRFALEYGWPDRVSTSHWFHDLAETEGKETFLDTLRRAVVTFYALTTTKSKADKRTAKN